MSAVNRTLQRLFNRRLAWALVWVLAVMTVAAAINVVGVRIVGNVNEWQRWFKSVSVYFLAWRLCLYGVTAYGWWWMRKRIKLREFNPDTTGRLRRTETAAVLGILAVEITVFLQSH